MDAAIDIVETYLRVNGFFTVTEYPILVRAPDGRLREGTDVDIMAVRMAGGGRVLPRPRLHDGSKMDIDPALDIDWRRTEMIIGEVKEGAADANRGMFREDLMLQALRRFGAVPRERLVELCKTLLAEGEAMWDGHRIRLVSFGTKPPHQPQPATYMPLRRVLEYLHDFVRRNRERGGQPRFRDPVLAQLAIQQKAEA